MFIVERSGFRLGNSFYGWAALGLLLLANPALLLTMHMHLGPKKEKKPEPDERR
jgi:hypothetical protein